jgi:hypothetical protein
MPNRLIERLGADYRELVGQYETIVNRCADEARDPTDAEVTLIDGLRSQMSPLSDRILELRQVEDSRAATITAMGGDPAELNWTASVVPGTGADVLTERQSPLPPLHMGETQLRSLMAAAASHQPWSETIELRAAITTPPTSVVGSWGYPSVPSGREDRLAQDLMTRGADGNTIQYLAVTTPALAGDVAEGAPKPDAGAVVTRRSAAVEKGACYSDVSTEMIADFADTDVLINTELLGSLTTWENGKVVAGITGDAGVLTPALSATSRLLGVLEAMQAVRSGSAHRQCDLVVINPADLVSLWGEQDTVGALMAGPAIVVQPTGELLLWGARLRQTVALSAGHVLVGQAADASWWNREPANVRIDPFSQSHLNLVRVIAEERGNAQPTTPAAWAYTALPAGSVHESSSSRGGAGK